MTKPKQPKLKAMPKKPKKSASIKVWENYDKRAAAVKKENKSKNSEYKKKLSAYNAEQKKKEAIANKY